MLRECGGPLVGAHDLVMFDLDGVVYVEGAALPGVADHVSRLRLDGMHVAFVTNNASRTPGAVAERLAKLGITASAADVVTSAQAAARLVRDRFGSGAKVLLLGGEGLEAALTEQAVEMVGPDDGPQVVVSGYGPDVLWRDIMRAARLVRDGVPYVASNADMTIPTAYGLAPGHGVLVRTISDFAGVSPSIAGKPERPLMDETVLRVGGEAPLMVGDRLDTDIEGANRLGVPSLLVMTGVTGLDDLASAGPECRPTYISPGTEGLFVPHAVPTSEDERSVLGGWTAQVRDGRLEVDGDGDPADWWRVAADALWRCLDSTGTPAVVAGVAPPVPPPGHVDG